jgi:oligopeptidase B
MMRAVHILGFLSGFLFLAAGALLAADSAAKPPVAKKVPHETVLHGDARVDDYFWLREKKDPEVIAYLEAENAYTQAVMEPTSALRDTLYGEILGRIKETDLSVPYKKRGRYYYSRTEEGKQYGIHCRRTGSLDAPEEVTLDLNVLAQGKSFLGLGEYDVSDDGNLLAYSMDTTGFRVYTLQVKDLRDGTLYGEAIPGVVSVAWAADNRTLFYTVENDAKRSYRLYRHVLGAAAHDLLYEEGDERFELSVHRSRSGDYIFAVSESHTASEVRFLSAGEPSGRFRVVVPRSDEHEYDVDHRGDRFYIRTNRGGRNFRLVTAPVSDPREENWKEIIPHRADVMIGGVDVFAKHFVTFEREGGLPHLRVTEVATGASHRIELPEPVYSVFPENNPEFDTSTYRFNYQSFTTPPSVFDYDMVARTRELKKETEVLGGYDRTRYVSERAYATAPDGARIPISLVYRKDLDPRGKNPLLLYGYGSYGISSSASFSHARVSLLDRGVVCATGHIRGGGEMGKPWHDRGRMLSKKNTFTDFIAVAEHLIAEGYTTPDRLVIEGRSAGGLLMGAVTNMRPDLFKAVVADVPFVDVINTMLDESLPLTVGEFEEWGNPRIEEEYDYMKTYCPYTNAAARSYPAMLVRTSLNDSQVMYWEPAKFVAKIRSLKTDSNPLLFKVEMAGGHGGRSGRYDKLRETAFGYAFILSELGLADSGPSKAAP